MKPCKGAIRWFRAHEKQYGYDASRMAALGASAGGHLSLMMGLTGGVADLEGGTQGFAFASGMAAVVASVTRAPP